MRKWCNIHVHNTFIRFWRLHFITHFSIAWACTCRPISGISVLGLRNCGPDNAQYPLPCQQLTTFHFHNIFLERISKQNTVKIIQTVIDWAHLGIQRSYDVEAGYFLTAKLENHCKYVIDETTYHPCTVYRVTWFVSSHWQWHYCPVEWVL